ncbi:putative hydrolase [Blastopirellula marina DSM 3645]|uniref:Putative hydrolase n=1 Tax=Blastopirellula marina DSM 3645 TaxID=314230 RepID=A3ZSD6_9BACT|nr:putative hydrolase [Blastopirellula marina DSM 3645]
MVPTWFEASAAEQAGLMELVNAVKSKLDELLDQKPDGYNVGFNAGDAAGQTVPHVHIHVIPRYRGDTADPRGGVRHVIPGKGNYLVKSPESTTHLTKPVGLQQLSAGHPRSPLWDHLSSRIAGARFVDVLASFVQLSGLDVIEERLFEAIRNEAQVRILVSDYLYISDAEALRRLLGWCDSAVKEFQAERLLVKLIEIAKLPSGPASFHPKAWRIADEHQGFLSVGSSNLSKPALQTGIEWNLLSTREADGLPQFSVPSVMKDWFGKQVTIQWSRCAAGTEGAQRLKWKQHSGARTRPGQVAERAVRAVVVEVLAPGPGLDPCVLQAQQVSLVQVFVAKAAVEAFAQAVLPGRSWFDVEYFDADQVQPGLDRAGDKLWAVVAANPLRRAMHREQLGERIDRVFAGNAAANLDRQALPRVLIHDVQKADRPAIDRR